jgi:hypothetical protein
MKEEMEIKKLKKVIQRVVIDKTTGTPIILRQSPLLTCIERGEADQVSCSSCPYNEVECDRLPDPRETGNLGSSFSDFCDSLHNDHYFKDEQITVTLDMIPLEGSLEESFAKFPKALRILKNRKGNKKV